MVIFILVENNTFNAVQCNSIWKKIQFLETDVQQTRSILNPYKYQCDDVILLLKKLSQILMFIFRTVHTKLEGIELEN